MLAAEFCFLSQARSSGVTPDRGAGGLAGGSYATSRTLSRKPRSFLGRGGHGCRARSTLVGTGRSGLHPALGTLESLKLQRPRNGGGRSEEEFRGGR